MLCRTNGSYIHWCARWTSWLCKYLLALPYTWHCANTHAGYYLQRGSWYLIPRPLKISWKWYPCLVNVRINNLEYTNHYYMKHKTASIVNSSGIISSRCIQSGQNCCMESLGVSSSWQIVSTNDPDSFEYYTRNKYSACLFSNMMISTRIGIETTMGYVLLNTFSCSSKLESSSSLTIVNLRACHFSWLIYQPWIPNIFVL